MFSFSLHLFPRHSPTKQNSTCISLLTFFVEPDKLDTRLQIVRGGLKKRKEDERKPALNSFQLTRLFSSFSFQLFPPIDYLLSQIITLFLSLVGKSI